MPERITIHHRNLEYRKAQLQHWKIPSSTKRELLKFLEQLELGRVNRGRKISSSRQLKYLDLLKVLLEFLNKPTAQFKLVDLERLEKALSTGKIISRLHGRPYRQSTLVDMRKLLRIFLRWRLGEPRALELTGWLDTHAPQKTPDFLTEAEIDLLYKGCKNPEQRFLITVLFDSGARAEEFHNIRMEDVFLPEGRESFFRIALKEEYSKTAGRTIALYWKRSQEAFQDYLQQRRQEGAHPQDPIFNSSYPAAAKFLRRLGQRVLKRNVHYHLFRHSSATYYANKLNRQELCYRYGWKFSSNMPDIYISRAGMETKQLDERFTQTELATVQNDLAKMEQVAKIKDHQIRQLEDSVRLLQQNLDAVSKVLRLNPRVEDVESALQRKKEGRGLQMPTLAGETVVASQHSDGPPKMG
ncbi:MAG: site-specific integrase [Verrucomicrobia bacterium]|nr:site-specific integrase [Verrucomicrobiota bacterium]